MTIDWGKELDKVEEATKPIAEGRHTFAITTATPTRASTGAQMIKLTVRVEGGPDDGKVGYPNVVFSFDNPKAMKMQLKRLAGLGIDPSILRAENLSIEQIAARLIGRTVEGTVSHRMWNGEVQSDVDFINGASSAAPGVPSVAPGIPSVPAAPSMPPAADEMPPTPDIPAAVVPTAPDTPSYTDEEPF